MMTTPCGHSPPTQSEPLPWALSQPASRSRHQTVRGTGWPIVTGQCRAPAIVTGGAGYLAGPAGVPLEGPAVDSATGADPATVLAGTPLQPRRTTLILAARAVAAISLRGIGRSFCGALLLLHRHLAAGSRLGWRGVSAPIWRW